MSKVFVGARAQNLNIGAEVAAITRVNLVVDSEHMYTAGNDTGRTLEVECPWGTQSMANSILANISSVNYKPFSAERALLDPAFEIGDAVTVGGMYSQISGADCTYNGASLVDIAAPELDEIDDEYPAHQTQQSSIKRQLAYTRSLITKSSSEILLKVEGTDGKGGLTGQVSEIKNTLDNISLTATNGSTSSKLVLKSGNVELASAEIKLTGVVTFEALGSAPGEGQTKINGGWIDADTLTVNAAKVSGTLWADQIKVGYNKGSQYEYTETFDNAVYTLITDELVSSPTIKGGAFYDTKSYGKLTLAVHGGDDDGVPWLHFYDTSNKVELFEVMPFTATSSQVLMRLGGVTVFQKLPDGTVALGSSVVSGNADLTATAVFA